MGSGAGGSGRGGGSGIGSNTRYAPGTRVTDGETTGTILGPARIGGSFGRPRVYGYAVTIAPGVQRFFPSNALRRTRG